MFRNLFSPDTPLMVTMSQITDCIFLSLFWFLCSIPLVTLGAATAALYDAVYHIYRKGDKNGWQRYFRSFRSNLKGSIPSSVLFVLLAAGLTRGTVLLWNHSVYGNISWGLFAAGAFLVFLAVGILSILFPMHSRFENSTGRLWSNTLRLAMARLPGTLSLSALNSFSIFLCLRYVFPLFFLPALACLIGSVFIEPMFRPFMPEESSGE